MGTLTAEQLKEVTDHLEEHYALIKKNRLYFFAGGAFATVALAVGLSYGAAMHAVELSATSTALKELASLNAQATTAVSEIKAAKGEADREVASIKRVREDAPNVLNVVVPQLSQRVSSLESRTDLVRVHSQNYDQDVPGQLAVPEHVQGGVIAAIIGVVNRGQPTIVTGDVGVVASEPAPGTPTGHECSFRIANGNLHANGACHGPLRVVYLYRPIPKISKPGAKPPSTKPGTKPIPTPVKTSVLQPAPSVA